MRGVTIVLRSSFALIIRGHGPRRPDSLLAIGTLLGCAPQRLNRNLPTRTRTPTIDPSTIRADVGTVVREFQPQCPIGQSIAGLVAMGIFAVS